MGLQGKTLRFLFMLKNEAVLTSTTIYVLNKHMKISDIYLKFFIFGGKIFSLFE